MRRLATAVPILVLSAAFYLLLIDTVSLPELYVLAAVAVLATVAFEVSREQGFTEASFKASWLLRAPLVLVRVPRHILILGIEAIAQLFQRRRARGVLRAVPFEGGMRARDYGRRAFAELIGSFAPNTIVIGVDPDRNLLLVHQLHREKGRDELDPLRLG